MDVQELAKKAVQDYLATPDGHRLVVEEGRVIRAMTPANARYVYVSDNCEEVLGFTAEEMLGQSAYDQVFADDVYRLTGVLEAAKEHPTKSMFRTRHKQRKPVWVEAHTAFHGGFVIAALRLADAPEAGAGWVQAAI